MNNTKETDDRLRPVCDALLQTLQEDTDLNTQEALAVLETCVISIIRHCFGEDVAARYEAEMAEVVQRVVPQQGSTVN